MIIYNKEISAKAYNNGYLCFYDKEHPLATEACQYRVFLHRHLASIKLGRWLRSDEHVHHIDGNKLNNELENLEVLTASEHARLHRGNTTKELMCPVCNTIFMQTYSEQKFCSIKCADSSKVKNTSITKELLDSLIPKYSWVELGKLFNYSDVGIRKRAKALGCTIPARRKTSG